jgi:acetylcholinesterase
MRDKIHREYITIDSSFGRIKGFIDKDAPNVAQFLGIPFAEPPVGPLRWKPPVPKSKPDTFDATEFGPSCPQVVTYHQSVYNTECREHRITDDTSEDCLSICIWAPASVVRDPSSKSLPVIVWITGGAFLVGGSTIPYQNPTPWVESSQRHIVVCIKYDPMVPVLVRLD